MDIKELKEVCRQVRIDIVNEVTDAKSGHPGGSLSAVEMMVATFYTQMRVDPKNPKDPDRDRFVLSKGHAAPCYYAVLAEKGLSCEVETEENLIVKGDPDKLARVFDNLLRNAISYSFPDTVIYIRAEDHEEEIAIEFINQGPEIPEGQLTTIFEKFYRMDSARSSKTGGAGLGLAIAKQIVSVHGGNIMAQNCEEGIKFIVKLPKIRT